MDKEKQWIKKIKKHADRQAANNLIAKYYKEMYRFVFKQTLDEQLSLDLTQEIFISVLKSIANYNENKASFRTWLYRLATNRLVDYYRSKTYKQSRLIEPIDDYDYHDVYDLTVSLEYKEDFETATSIINQLDAVSQQIIRLKLFGEYTFKEIAEMENMPESTVKTKYYAAIKQIRKEMREHSHGQWKISNSITG